MSKKTALVLSASFAMLTGCFPVKEQYFEPSSEGGSVRGQYCGNGGGPPSRIDMNFGGGKISLSAYRSSTKSSAVTVTFYIFGKRESTYRLVPAQFQAYGATGYKVTPLKLAEVIHGRRFELTLDQKVELVATKDPAGGPAFFILSLDVDVGNEQVFDFVIPSIEVDGISSPSRVVHFQEKQGVFVSPINC